MAFLRQIQHDHRSERRYDPAQKWRRSSTARLAATRKLTFPSTRMFPKTNGILKMWPWRCKWERTKVEAIRSWPRTRQSRVRRLLEDGLIHVSWHEKPLCSVDRDGIVRFRPADITGPEVDRQLRTVILTAGHVKEYMRIFERAPALKAIGLDDTYKVLADFGDAVLAGQLGKKGR